MILNKYKKLFFLAALLASSVVCADGIGVVSSSKCIADSKLGKTEQANFENLRKQLGSFMEKTEKELQDLMSKENDAEYMDGLSPEAAIELRTKIQGLTDEMMRYQNQSYQVLNQTSARLNQMIFAEIALAAGEVAEEMKLDLVLSQENACFYRKPSLDISDAVVVKMDLHFDKNAKDGIAPPAETTH